MIEAYGYMPCFLLNNLWKITPIISLNMWRQGFVKIDTNHICELCRTVYSMLRFRFSICPLSVIHVPLYMVIVNKENACKKWDTNLSSQFSSIAAYKHSLQLPVLLEEPPTIVVPITISLIDNPHFSFWCPWPKI